MDLKSKIHKAECNWTEKQNVMMPEEKVYLFSTSRREVHLRRQTEDPVWAVISSCFQCEEYLLGRLGFEIRLGS